MIKCAYFKIQELVPKSVYEQRGEKAWQLLDSRLIILCDYLRIRYGPMTVNDYLFGGDNEYRGLRTQESKHYRKFSQHSFGRAVDASFKLISAEEVRQDLQKIEEDLTHDFDCLTIELDVNWLHIDVRNNKPGLNYFKP